MFISKAIYQQSFDIFQGKPKECKQRTIPAMMETAGAVILLTVGIIGLLSQHGVALNSFPLGTTGSAISTVLGGAMVIDLAFFCVGGIKAHLNKKKKVHEEVQLGGMGPEAALAIFKTKESKYSERNSKFETILGLVKSKQKVGDITRCDKLTECKEKALTASIQYSKDRSEENRSEAAQAIKNLDRIIQELEKL